MEIEIDCRLCGNPASLFHTIRDVDYLRCEGCKSVFMRPAHMLKAEDEKARYLKHRNDVHDQKYRDFAAPVVNEVTRRYHPEGSRGLDYGTGTGPVIATILREHGYEIALYDPFFWDQPQVLQGRYDFIVCSEVMEHFHHPFKEFQRMRELLVSGGALILMTEIFHDEVDFQEWYYKNDETHVFFYHPDALEWICRKFQFSSYTIDGRVIVYAC